MRAECRVPSWAQEWGAHSLRSSAWEGYICVCGKNVPMFTLVSAQQVRLFLPCPPVSVYLRVYMHTHTCASVVCVCNHGWVCWRWFWVRLCSSGHQNVVVAVFVWMAMWLCAWCV